jgi:hypothetical protein
LLFFVTVYDFKLYIIHKSFTQKGKVRLQKPMEIFNLTIVKPFIMGTNKLIQKMLCSLLLGASAFSVSAQLQLNVGYGVLKTQPTALNQIISKFNESYGNQLVAPMSVLKSLEGIHAELAFFADPVYVGLEWQNLTRDLNNRFKDPLTNEDVINTFHYANDMLSLHGCVMLLRNIGVGMTGDFNINQLKQIASTNRKHSTLLMYSTQFSSRFYLHLNVPLNDWMSIGLRPYVRMPWNSISYAPVASRLRLDMQNTVLSEKKMDFGIQMVWQNFLSPRNSN